MQCKKHLCKKRMWQHGLSLCFCQIEFYWRRVQPLRFLWDKTPKNLRSCSGQVSYMCWYGFGNNSLHYRLHSVFCTFFIYCQTIGLVHNLAAQNVCLKWSKNSAALTVAKSCPFLSLAEKPNVKKGAVPHSISK